MRFWIDIEDAAGNRIGDGPITTATNWRHSPRMDEAGEIAFELPAADPRTAIIARKRVAHAWGVVNGVPTELGQGIIDADEVDASGETPMLRVSGPDILHELATRTVGGLAIKVQEWIYLNGGNGAVRWLTDLAEPDKNLPQAYDGNHSTITEHVGIRDYWWLYVGCDSRFDAVRFYFSVYNTGSQADMQVQYYSAENGWAELANTNTTYVNGRPFAKDGDISWVRPTDWARVTPTKAAGDWFWVRIRRTTGNDFGVNIREVQVYADLPTTGALDLIMAYAPDTWTQSGYPATAKEVYHQFDGESVLQALRVVAQYTGEHFRLGAGRSIEWLASIDASGLRAVQAGDPVAMEANDDVALITRLTRKRDASAAYTRIIPFGADGISLALTTRTPPTGYTLDKGANHIRLTDESALGRIEHVARYNDIALQQADSYTLHPVMASNALFDRALADLQQHSSEETFVTLAVVKVPQAILPGQTIRVVYHGFVDGYQWLDLDTDLYILGTDVQVDGAGVHTVGLDVASVPRPAESDARVVAGAIETMQRATPAGGSGGWVAVPVGGSSQADTVDGFHAAGWPLPGYLLALDAAGQFPASTIELAAVSGLEVASGLAISDSIAGAGLVISNKIMALRTPTANLSHNSVNAVNANGHTHAIDASASPGAMVSLLKTDAAGFVTLEGLHLRDGDTGFSSPGTKVINPLTDNYLRSPGFASGLNGWEIAADGSAEFNNISLRGALYAPVFVKNLIEAHAGTLMVTKSAGKLAVDMDVPAAGTWLMVVTDPPGGGFLFESGDVCRVRGEHAGGIGDTWFTVSDRADLGDGTQQYTCTYLGGTRPITYAAGVPVIDYGQASDGGLMLTADMSHAPYLSVFTHDGTPHMAISDRVRLGNLRGWGGVATDIYGLAAGDPAGGNYLLATGAGVEVHAGGGAITIDSTGLRVDYDDDNAIRLEGATPGTYSTIFDSHSIWGANSGFAARSSTPYWALIESGGAKLAMDGTVNLAKLQSRAGGTNVTLGLGDASNTWAAWRARSTPALELAIGTGATPDVVADYRRHGAFRATRVAPQVLHVGLTIPASTSVFLVSAQYAWAMLGAWNLNTQASHSHCLAEIHRPASGEQQRFFTNDRGAVYDTTGELYLYLNDAGALGLRNGAAVSMRFSGWIFYY